VGVRPRQIEVHIDELVLEGVSAADRLSVGAAVQRELGRLLAERGLPEGFASAGEHETVDGGSFERSPGATPARLGDQVAGAVYGSLRR
jgi:hypothetical protein